MTIPRSVLIAIGEAVQKAGGDESDVDDLVDTWRRVHGDGERLADRMRYEAQTATCTCADGGEVNGDGRCQRCYGRLEVTK